MQLLFLELWRSFFTSNNFSSLPEPSHIYNNSGTYMIKLVTLKNGIYDTSENNICVETPPIHLTLKDTTLCHSDSFVLNAGNPGCTYLLV